MCCVYVSVNVNMYVYISLYVKDREACFASDICNVCCVYVSVNVNMYVYIYLCVGMYEGIERSFLRRISATCVVCMYPCMYT